MSLILFASIAAILPVRREASLLILGGRDRLEEAGGESPLRTGARSVHPLYTFDAFLAQEASSRSFPQERILGEAEEEVEQGQLDEAYEKCQQVIAADPNSAYAYFLVGVIEFERGADEKAKKDLEQSLKLDPSRIASHVALGKVYINLKLWPQAQRAFQQAITLGDTSGSGHFGLGLALIKESRPADALPHLIAAVKADPEEWEWQFTLVGAELNLKRVDDARRYLAPLLHIHNADPWAAFRLGKLLEEHDLTEEAHAGFRIAIEAWEASPNLQRGSTLSDLYLQIAHAEYEHRDFEGALESLGKVETASLDPKLQADALNLLGLALIRTGKFDEGSPRLHEAAEQSPTSPDYAYDWMWAELLAGRVTAAAQDAENAERQWPNNPDIQTLRAIIHQETSPERVHIPFLAHWHLRGEGFVCCPCKVPCPCRSNGPPTYGKCESTGAYRIREGSYHDIRLDGLVFVEADTCMSREKAPALLYVQPTASDEQVIAMERIFQSLDPLRPFLFLNVNRAPISFESSEQGQLFQVEIPGAVEMKIRRRLNSKRKPLLETAALDRFSNTIEYAQNLTYKLWDKDGRLRFNYSGRQANFRMIQLSDQDFRDIKMLLQYADGTGYFNEKQLELINTLKLPTLHSYPGSPAISGHN